MHIANYVLTRNKRRRVLKLAYDVSRVLKSKVEEVFIFDEK
jgi:DNA-binding XRE family transcriptional regulator